MRRAKTLAHESAALPTVRTACLIASLREGPWIVGQLYVMTAMVIFVIGGAAILGNI